MIPAKSFSEFTRFVLLSQLIIQSPKRATVWFDCFRQPQIWFIHQSESDYILKARRQKHVLVLTHLEAGMFGVFRHNIVTALRLLIREMCAGRDLQLSALFV